MADPASVQEGFAWLTGAGGGAGGVLMTLGGMKVYARFFRNGQSSEPSPIAELAKNLQAHHERELEALMEINGSIRELSAYMKGVMTR